MGGPHSREAGLKLWADSTLWSVVGASEALGRLLWGIRLYWKLRNYLIAERPDLVVLIDAPAIHMRLAAILKARGIKCLYYFPPSAWTRNPRRLNDIHRRVDSVIATFEVNARNYQALGLPVAYFGHPLVEQCQASPREQALAQLGLPEGRYAALLPGSRTQEIRLLLPDFWQTAQQLQQRHPALHWILPSANEPIEKLVRQVIGQPPPWLHLCSGQSRTVMGLAEVGLLASGSATLEASLLGLPHLICYRLNRFDFSLARLLFRVGLLKVTHFGLPNLVADQAVVSEFLQDQVSPQNLVPALEELLGSGRQQALERLSFVRAGLGSGQNVVDQIAHYIAEQARS